MHEPRLARFSVSLALVLGSFHLPAAQGTYNLRGKGAKQGMTFDQTLAIKIKKKTSGQGQNTDSTTFSKADGNIQVKAVDAGGDVIEASEAYSGEISVPGGQRQNFPSAKLFKRAVDCRLEDGTWKAALDELSDETEVQNEHSDLPMPGLQRDFLPGASVPVGHKWMMSSKDCEKIIEVQIPKYAKQIKGLTGSASCTFEKVGNANGVLCAYIRIEYTFKGSMLQDDERLLPMKISLKGNSSEIRRLDLGILTQQESLLEISGSGQGNGISLSIERFMAQKLGGQAAQD